MFTLIVVVLLCILIRGFGWFRQGQLCEREQTIHELERKMEEKERELHAVRLDNDAVSLRSFMSVFLVVNTLAFLEVVCSNLCLLGMGKGRPAKGARSRISNLSVRLSSL